MPISESPSTKRSMIADLLEIVLTDMGAACRRVEYDHIRSTGLKEDGVTWVNLIFIIEDDTIYASQHGVEVALCMSEPDADLETWVKKLRDGEPVGQLV